MKKTLQTLLAKKPAKNAESNLLCIWSVAIKIRLCNPHIMGIGIYLDSRMDINVIIKGEPSSIKSNHLNISLGKVLTRNSLFNNLIIIYFLNNNYFPIYS